MLICGYANVRNVYKSLQKRSIEQCTMPSHLGARERALIVKLYEDGLSMSEIAYRYRLVRTVCRWIER